MNQVPANQQAPVAFHLTNCDAKAANFIASVVKLFTDPKFADQVRLLRHGNLVLRMIPATGSLEIACDGTPSTPQNFVNN